MTAQGANTDRVRNDDDEARRNPWCFQAMVQDCRIALLVVVNIIMMVTVSEDYLLEYLCLAIGSANTNTIEEILFFSTVVEKQRMSGGGSKIVNARLGMRTLC